MFDNHLHTEVSADSSMLIDDAIKSAEEKGIGLILTEHMDITRADMKLGEEFTFDVSEYFAKYKEYRNEKLLLGMEVGFTPEFVEQNNNAIKSGEFDFIIGSIHVVNKIDIFQHIYYETRTKREAYEEYLETMKQCLKLYDNIDSLGHIDYICRYATYDDKEIYYNEFSDYIDEVLKVVIEKEKAIEINTRRLNSSTAKNNLFNIYKRYKELGGKIVTIGSDSHRANDIGANFKEAIDIIDNIGLKNVYYKNRKIYYDDRNIK